MTKVIRGTLENKDHRESRAKKVIPALLDHKDRRVTKEIRGTKVILVRKAKLVSRALRVNKEKRVIPAPKAIKATKVTKAILESKGHKVRKVTTAILVHRVHKGFKVIQDKPPLLRLGLPPSTLGKPPTLYLSLTLAPLLLPFLISYSTLPLQMAITYHIKEVYGKRFSKQYKP